MRLPARLGLLLLLCALPGVTWGEPSIEEQVREQMRIAVEHSRAARYAEAFGAFDRGLEIAERHGEQGLAARVLRERGIAYIHQASYEDARADLERSAEIYESLGDVSRASKARLHIISMRGYNEPEWGLAELRKIEERLEKIDDAKTLREVQLFRARLLLGRGDHEEALAILAPLREHYAATPARLGDVLNLEAYALQQLGRFEESRTAYLDLISAAFENGNQRQIAYAYCNLGDVERELGVPVAAEASLDRAIETLDRLRSQIPGGVEERMTYLDAQVSAYDGKILLLVDERRDPIGALEVAERFHAKSLLEELHAPSRSSSSGELGKEERAVLAALIELQQKLIRTGLNDEEENELRELEGRWDRAARDRRRDTAQKIAEVTPRSPADVQAQLPDGTAMLAYWIHAERSLLWVLRRDRIELIQVPVGREELREKIARYLEPIRDRVRADDLAVRGDERAHLDLGAELYRLLIEPARSLLAGVDSLIVVPDDHLWHLPFEALVLETGEAKREKDEPWFAGYARARFLIEDFRLHYAHSASVWAELRERDPAGRGLIAIAPSLDGSAVARDRGLEPDAPADGAGRGQPGRRIDRSRKSAPGNGRNRARGEGEPGRLPVRALRDPRLPASRATPAFRPIPLADRAVR